MIQPPSALAVSALRNSTLLADRVVLTSERLSKPVYADVKRVLTAFGGEWSTSEQAFLFDYDYRDSLTAVLDGTGQMPRRNPTAFFPTPDELAAWVMSRSLGLANLPEGARVLEPSAGRGALISAALAVRPDLRFEACEIDPHHRRHLVAQGVKLVGEDFMGLPETGEKYDAVVMNPPFSLEGEKNAWLSHVQKAQRLLAQGGTLIAILPESAAGNAGGTAGEVWRKKLASMGGEFAKNPKGAFKSSGTLAGTVTLFIGGFLSDKLVSQREQKAQNNARAQEVIDRVASIAPATDHATEVAEANASRREFGYSKLLFPKATRLSDILSSLQIWEGDEEREGTYVNGSGSAAEAYFKANVRPAAKAVIDASLVVHDGHIELVTTDNSDGWTRVFWKNSRILGSRFLAIVETRSIVPFVAADEDADHGSDEKAA